MALIILCDTSLLIRVELKRLGDVLIRRQLFNIFQAKNKGSGSTVEPASCYWKVTGSIPLVEVSFGKILNPKLLLMCWLAPCMATTVVSV